MGIIIILVFDYCLVTKKNCLFNMTETIFLYLHKWMMQVVIYMDIRMYIIKKRIIDILINDMQFQMKTAGKNSTLHKCK